MVQCHVGYFEYMPFLPHTLEWHVHPKDFSKVVSSLLNDTQLFTNNPYVVDCFPAESVFVWDSGGKKRLDQHPDWLEWKDVMSTGEFWSMVGEDWKPVIRGA